MWLNDTGRGKYTKVFFIHKGLGFREEATRLAAKLQLRSFPLTVSVTTMGGRRHNTRLITPFADRYYNRE